MSQALISWVLNCSYSFILVAYFWDGFNQLDKSIAVLLVPVFIGYMAGNVASHYYIQRGEIYREPMSRLSLATPMVAERSHLIDFVRVVLWFASWYVVYDSPSEWWVIQLGTILASILAAAVISHVLYKAQKNQS